MMDLRNIVMEFLRPFKNRGKYEPEKRGKYEPEKRGKYEPEKRGKYQRENSRKYPRVFVDLPFEYWTRDNPHARRGGIVINASQIGFLIHSIENMPVGTHLNLNLFYILGYGLANLEVFVEIVWKNLDKNWGYLYGLKFIGILKEDHFKLKGLLDISLEFPPIQPSAERNSLGKFNNKHN
jgi:hypothetical protein